MNSEYMCVANTIVKQQTGAAGGCDGGVGDDVGLLKLYSFRGR